MQDQHGRSVSVSFSPGTVICLPPIGEGAAWRFFVIGCRCILPLARRWHRTLAEAEACGMSVIASTPPPDAG